MQKGIFLFIFSILFFASPLVSAQTTSCLLYSSGSSVVANYAPSWDVFDSSHALLIKTNCPTSGTNLTLTIGRGEPTQLVHNISYSYHPGATPVWQPHTLSGTVSAGTWLTGTGTGSLTAPDNAATSNPFYFVGFTCQNRSGSWKCGCADTSCVTPKWQLQAYTGLPANASTGGNTTGGSSTAGSTTGAGTTGGGTTAGTMGGSADIVVIEGDSISNNNSTGSASNPRSASDWTRHIGTYVSWFSHTNAYYIGASAETVAQMLAQYPTQSHIHKPTGNQKAYYIIYGGVNDLKQWRTRSPDAIYTDLKKIWSSARADGFKVVAMTVYPFALSGTYASDVSNIDIARRSLNTLILSDPSLYDGIVRLDQMFTSIPSATDPYFADRVHTNFAGAKKIAEAVANIIK